MARIYDTLLRAVGPSSAPRFGAQLLAGLDMAPFSPEMIEQPTNSEHPAALAKGKANSTVLIAADQGVFTPADVNAVCTSGSADLIVLGLHETGGIARFQKGGGFEVDTGAVEQAVERYQNEHGNGRI